MLFLDLFVPILDISGFSQLKNHKTASRKACIYRYFIKLHSFRPFKKTFNPIPIV